MKNDPPEALYVEEPFLYAPLHILAGLLLAAAICLAGFLGLDLRLAALAARALSLAPALSEHVSDIPDLLFPFTTVLVLLSWSAHLSLRRRGRPQPWSALSLRIGISLPIAFCAKAILKVVFGRINARVWLSAPQLYGFHWFHGGGDFAGFPSGHMAVFTPIALALAWAFPGQRKLFAAGLVLLALALLITDYHFLSDVAMGAYLGILADATAVRIMHKTDAMARRRAAPT